MKKLTDKFSRRTIAIVVICLMFTFGAAGVYAAFGGAILDSVSVTNKVIATPPEGVDPDIQMPDEQQAQIVKDKKIQADADKIEVSGDMDVKLKGKPNKNLLVGYKRMLAEKNVPSKQRERLEQILLSSDDPQAVLVLFDYLHDNFFTFADLEAALVRYNGGQPLEEVLQGFVEVEGNFVAKDYEHNEIERLLTTPGIMPDDIALAEVLDFRGVAPFYDIINARISSKEWQDIGEQLDLINVTGSMKSVAITSAEVKECMDQLSVSEDEAVSKVVRAKKAGVRSEKVAEFVKSGKPVGKAIKETAEDKLSK